jgi:uncharacterized protein YgiM (DUF1202 family)
MLGFRAMKRFAVALLFFAVCCSKEPVVTETVDTRAPIKIRYVASPQLAVRQQPNDAAAVVATYQSGEAVSVLVEKGDWTEIRTGDRSGWVKTEELTNAEAKQALESDPAPRFRIMPLPVSAPAVHGEIYIQADVNSDGEVVATKVITNTTGSADLAAKNAEALRAGRFYPIVIKGERKPFQYFHKVTY